MILVHVRAHLFRGLFAAAMLFLSAARASALHPDFDALHQEYLSLRNTDLEFKRIDEWRKLERDFIELARNEKDALRAQRALLEGAILYQTLATRIDPEKNRLRALAELEELVGRFPRGALADDALLAKAEILAEDGSSESLDVLRSITTQYPDSDMALVATDRLNGRTSAKTAVKDVAASQGNQLPILVLDPGHGGEDFGALGFGGLLEKDVALDIAIKAKKLIEDRGTFRVLLTRSKDQFVPLADRMAFANQKEAKFFISIHANASVKKNMSGIETYYLDNKADKASTKLAERENKVGAGGENEGGDLSFMLSDLIQNAKLPESIALAKTVQQSLVKAAMISAPTTKSLGAKSAPFYVLVGAHMPCVLVEVAFIDHVQEGKRLGEQAYRQLLAQGIAEGVHLSQ